MNLTITELIEILELLRTRSGIELLELLKHLRHRAPLRAATHLTAVWKGTTMSAINLKWIDATTRVDGKPGTVATVHIYDERTQDTAFATVPGGAQTFDVMNYPPGDYRFAIIFEDSDGVKSDLSNVASVTVPQPTAASPLVAATDLTATFVP